MVSDDELARHIERAEGQREEVDQLDARVEQLEESAKLAHDELARRIERKPDAESLEQLVDRLDSIEQRLESLEERLE